MYPENLVQVLYAFGVTPDDLHNKLSYANGVMMVITGNTQDGTGDGTQIITQDLQSGMDSLGITTGDLAQFLITLDDNLKALSMSSQGQIGGEVTNLWRLFYFTLFLEYIRFHAINNKYRTPQQVMENLHGRLKLRQADITPEQTAQTVGQLVSFQVFDRSMYALTVLNPAGVEGVHICPWVFIYNDQGSNRMFLSKQDMLDYDDKYGKGVERFVKGMFSKKNLPFTLILGGGVAGLAVVSGVLLKKRHTKKVDEQKKILAEIESEAESQYDTEEEILNDNVGE